MNEKRRVTDRDTRGAEQALHRAAKDARRIAYATNTPLVIWENGRVVKKRMTLKDIE